MEPMKSKAPQLHLEYRFYKLLGSHGTLIKHLFAIIKLSFSIDVVVVVQKKRKSIFGPKHKKILNIMLLALLIIMISSTTTAIAMTTTKNKFIKKN
jgi:hypothetical protein